MHSTVKFPAAHFRRRPSLPSLRSWVLLTSLVSLISMGVARPHQDFPVAAEEHHYIFRSDGTYSFSYDTGDGQHQSFRIETRDATGRVSGRYGYIDPDGVLRITHYQADSTGYRANMLIYRKVTSPPPEPLLVGPLPRRVSDPEVGVAPRNAPQQTASGPIGPVPFFPPDKPVLIIGPLPKPLQPLRGDDDFEPDEGFDFDTSQGVSLSSPAQDVQQESSVIKDVPQGPPPDTIPSSVLETILQDNFNRIFQGPIPDIFNNPASSDSQDISFNTLHGLERPGVTSRPTSSQEDLVRISQELLQGPPEVIVDMAPERREIKPLAFRPHKSNRTRVFSNSTDDRVPRAPPLDSVNIGDGTRQNNNLSFNNTVDVFVKVVTDFPSLNNVTQESKNNYVTASLSKSTTPTPPISLKRNDSSPSRPSGSNTLIHPPPLVAVNRENVSKPDTQRASSLAVSINLPPVPPLTYLPADNTKIPIHSTFVGQLPDY